MTRPRTPMESMSLLGVTSGGETHDLLDAARFGSRLSTSALTTHPTGRGAGGREVTRIA